MRIQSLFIVDQFRSSSVLIGHGISRVCYKASYQTDPESTLAYVVSESGDLIRSTRVRTVDIPMALYVEPNHKDSNYIDQEVDRRMITLFDAAGSMATMVPTIEADQVESYFREEFGHDAMAFVRTSGSYLLNRPNFIPTNEPSNEISTVIGVRAMPGILVTDPDNSIFSARYGLALMASRLKVVRVN